MDDNVFVGLDIGTTKIACIISEQDANGELKIVGVGVSPSDGLRKGVVVNIDKTVRSIQKAVEEAELMAGVDVDAVWVGIAGDHIGLLTAEVLSRFRVTITKFLSSMLSGLSMLQKRCRFQWTVKFYM